MAVDERERHELFLSIERSLGPDVARTLMSLLPPVGWADVATRQDLDALGHRVDAQIADLRTELRTGLAELRAELSTQAAGLRGELVTESSGRRADVAGVRTEIAGVRTEMTRMRGDLVTQMAAGQRQLLFAMLGAMLTLAGLAWAAITLI